MLQNNPLKSDIEQMNELYSGVTGVQLTATSLTAGVTYVITYDKFTRKFFVTGV